MFLPLILKLLLGSGSLAQPNHLEVQVDEANSVVDEPHAAAIPVKRTPMSRTEARLHLELAYRAAFDQAPSTQTLSLLLAQWALETGRGEHMWAYNFGGLKAVKRGASLMTEESFGANLRRLPQRFRTYSRAQQGARDYVETLRSDFPLAFAALNGGHALQFVQGLATEGYFTANKAAYERAIVQLSAQFERELRGSVARVARK